MAVPNVVPLGSPRDDGGGRRDGPKPVVKS